MYHKPIKIALVGNPNCGKTTVFNALTGSRQYVGNRAGVTVEEKEAFLKGNKQVIITDLPGVYSLTPYTLEERVTEDYILNESPDAVLIVADASDLHRGLYLTLQLLRTGIPSVLMLNMIDLAEKRRMRINIKELGDLLGIKVCTASASKGKGIFEAAALALEAAKSHRTVNPPPLPRDLDILLDKIGAIVAPFLTLAKDKELLPFYTAMLFEREGGVAEKLNLSGEALGRIDRLITEKEKAYGDSSDSILIGAFYDIAEGLFKKCVIKKPQSDTFTEKADRLLMGRYTALPCFALIMTAVYYLSVGPFGLYLSECMSSLIIEGASSALGRFLESTGCADWLVSLLSEGVIGGTGTVLGFLPQLALLFFMLAVLEDLGYMSRVVFITDRFFRKFGLSGKSFIPMLIATGCGVPAIMSSRTIENPSRRRITIITSTFMPCGAKLPVIALISASFFPGKWWIAPLCYFIGVFSILLSGLILKKLRLFSSDDEPFVLDMPSYRLPTAKNVFRALRENCGSFLKRAGSTVLLASVALWLLSSLGFSRCEIAFVNNMENSFLKNIGELLSVVFEPLGFGKWQPSVACVMGLLAKEEIVGALGVLSHGSLSALFETPVAGFSFLVFNLLCAPCTAAVSTMKKELNSGLYTAFALFYQTVFAYTVSFCIYNIGSFFLFGEASLVTVCAFAAAIGTLAYALVPKRRK